MSAANPTPTRPDIPKITEKDITRALWICFFAWTFAVYDFVLFGSLLPPIAQEFGWSSSTSTAVNTWVTGGTALVAFLIGPMVDRLGRKKGIVIAVAGAAVFSLLTALLGWVAGVLGGSTVVLLIIIRSVAGLGYSEQAISATYINELFAQTHTDPVKARRRGFIYSLVQAGWPVGSVIAAVSIYLLEPIGGWKLCFVVSIFPAVFIGLAARYLKETPQFVGLRAATQLLKAGHTEEAHSLADRIGLDLGARGVGVTEIFRGNSLRPTVFNGFAFLLNWLGVLVFSILGTSLLSADSGKNIDFSNAIAILAIANGTAFLGYLVHGWVGDRFGRRNTIAVGWILCFCAFTGMLLVPDGNFAPIVALYSVGEFFLIGPYSALLFFNSESYPTRTRATGGAFLNALGQVGAVVAGILMTSTLDIGWSWTISAFVWGCIPILLSGLVLLGARNVHPETVLHG